MVVIHQKGGDCRCRKHRSFVLMYEPKLKLGYTCVLMRLFSVQAKRESPSRSADPILGKTESLDGSRGPDIRQEIQMGQGGPDIW